MSATIDNLKLQLSNAERTAANLRAEIADLRAKLAARERACEELREAFQSSVIAIDTLIAFVCPEGLTLVALQRISEASSAALVAALDSGTPSDKGGKA